MHGEYGATFTAVAGTTYRIQVDSQGNPAHGIVGPQPPFTVALSKAVPCNDTFSCAHGLAYDVPLPLTGSVLTDNVGATAEAGEPAHAGSAAAHSLWWQITPPVGASVTLSTAGSGIDTVLAVYTGTRVDALSRVAADDDTAGGGASRVTFAGAGGTSYRVAVDGKAGATGQLQLAWRLDIPAPRNDLFANATVLSGSQGSSPSYTWSATKEAGEPAHEGVAGGRSIWWRYTPSAAARLRLTLTTDYTVLSVYRGSSVGALTRVTGARQIGVQPIVVDVDVAAGVTYQIAVDLSDLVNGPDVATLAWTLYPTRPPNDDIANAVAISGSTGSIDGHDVGATASNSGEPYNRWGENSTVFYRWTAPSTGLFVFDTLTSDYDTYLWLYRGWATALNPLPVVAHNDDATSLRLDPDDFHNVVGADHTSAAAVNAVAGQVYTIVVDGPPLQQGRFTLHWGPATPWAAGNDRFAAAQPLSGASGTVTGRLADTTAEPGEPGDVCCSVWFSWTAPSTGPVRLWTSDEGINPLLSVYTGSSLSTLALVTENAVGLATSGARVDLTATAGTTYRIRLAVRTGEAAYWPATVQLRWGPPPAPPGNDAFAAAAPLSGTAGSVTGSAQWATREPGEPTPPNEQPAATVWYRWSAPTSGIASFWVQSRALLPIIGVYTGSRVDALSPLEGIGTPGVERLYGSVRITFPATAGVTYSIQVQGTDYLGAPFFMLWSMAPPPHDNIANALPLSGARGYSPGFEDWRGTTIRATAEPGEPNHAPGRSPGATTWFRWTAPASGPVRFSVAEASVDNMLACYSGSGYGSLVQLARTDWQFWHDLSFDAVAGQTYLIVADTGPYGGGQLGVEWSQHADQAKPTGGVVVDGGASSTSRRMVTLTLSATDNVGVTGVLISNSPTLEDRVADAGPQRTLMWAEQLEGNPGTVRWSLTDLVRGGNNSGGAKTVYVQWRDAQGNWSAVASDTIVANLPALGDTTPPTAMVPAAVVASGSRVGGLVPTRVSWSATDATSGVPGYQLEQRTDGGAWVSLTLPGPLVTASVRSLAPGHSYQYRVRAVDGAGLWSGWQYGPVLRPALYQETTTALAWSGTWIRYALTGASGGYVRGSSQALAQARFTAGARSIGWVAVRAPNRGKAAVYVDGVLAGTVDLYASTVQPARIVFVRSWGATGTHTVTVRVNGTASRPRVEVDAFVLLR